jgi:hypothetical protein
MLLMLVSIALKPSGLRHARPWPGRHRFLSAQESRLETKGYRKHKPPASLGIVVLFKRLLYTRQ